MKGRELADSKDGQAKKRRKVSFALMRKLFGTDSDDSDDEDLDALSEALQSIKVVEPEEEIDISKLTIGNQ